MATIETIGPSGCDYTTPQAWYDAHSGDITADAGAPYIGEIEAGSYPELTMQSAYRTAGSTTDATHYFHLLAKAGEGFAGNTGGSFPKIAGITCYDDYARFEGVASTAMGTEGLGCFVVGGKNTLVDRCAVYGVTWHFAGVGDLVLYGFLVDSPTLGYAINTVFRNCVAADLYYNDYEGGCYGIGANNISYWDSVAAYHCSIRSIRAMAGGYGGSHARGIALPITRNCAVADVQADNAMTIDSLDGLSGSRDYNAVDDEAVGAGVHGQTLVTFVSEWVSSVDFHLAATSTALRGNAGSLSGYANAPTVDIDGEPIGDDIGADTNLPKGTGEFTRLSPFAVPGRLYGVFTKSLATSNITGTTLITFTPDGTIIGHSTLDGSSLITFTPSGILVGRSSLDGSSLITFTPDGTIIGRSNLDGSSLITFTPDGSITAKGTLDGSSLITFTPGGSIIGHGSLTGNTTALFSTAGSLGSPVTIIGTTGLVFTLSGSITAKGSLDGSSLITFTPNSSIIGRSSLDGSSILTFTISSPELLSKYLLTGSTGLTFAANASVFAQGTLLGSTSLLFLPVGTLIGSGILTGETTIVFTTDASIRNIVDMKQRRTLSIPFHTRVGSRKKLET